MIAGHERRNPDQGGIDDRSWALAAGAPRRRGGGQHARPISAGSTHAGVPACAANDSAASSAAGIAARNSGPGRVDPALRVVVRAPREEEPAEREPDQADRDVDQEDEAPAAERRQHSTEHRSDAQPDRLSRALHSEPGAQPRGRQDVADERVGVRLEHHGADRLDEPRERPGRPSEGASAQAADPATKMPKP